MGSFPITCRVSGLGIDHGEPVVILLLNKKSNTSPNRLHRQEEYQLCAPPIYGNYSDYGYCTGDVERQFLGKSVLSYWEILLGDLSGHVSNDYEELLSIRFESLQQITHERNAKEHLLFEIGVVHRKVWDALLTTEFKDDIYIGEGNYRKRTTSLASYKTMLDDKVDKWFNNIVAFRQNRECMKRGEESVLFSVSGVNAPFLGIFYGDEDGGDIDETDTLTSILGQLRGFSTNWKFGFIMGSLYARIVEDRIREIMLKSPQGNFENPDYQVEAKRLYRDAILEAVELIIFIMAIEDGGGTLHRKPATSQDPSEELDTQISFHKKIMDVAKMIKKERKRGRGY